MNVERENIISEINKIKPNFFPKITDEDFINFQNASLQDKNKICMDAFDEQRRKTLEIIKNENLLILENENLKNEIKELKEIIKSYQNE